MSLKTIPGGEEVREYYNFLTHTQIENDDEDTEAESPSDISLLPKPEQMSPIWESFGEYGTSHSGAGFSRDNPISMAVVNPIRASVITSSAAPQSSTGMSGAVQNNIDFNKMKQEILSSFDDQKEAIMQTLNYIVIDSNIEKMHQNLKKAITNVNSDLEKMKDKLEHIVQETGDDAAFPTVSSISETTDKIGADKKSINRHFEKIRKNKKGTKFSVDMTDLDDEN